MKRLLAITCLLILLFVSRSSSKDNVYKQEMLVSYSDISASPSQTQMVAAAHNSDPGKSPALDICVYKQCDLKGRY